MLGKIAYSAQNSAQTSLFCLNSARYPKKILVLRAVFIFVSIEESLVLTLKKEKKKKMFIMRSKVVIHLTFNVSAL